MQKCLKHFRQKKCSIPEVTGFSFDDHVLKCPMSLSKPVIGMESWENLFCWDNLKKCSMCKFQANQNTQLEEMENVSHNNKFNTCLLWSHRTLGNNLLRIEHKWFISPLICSVTSQTPLFWNHMTEWSLNNRLLQNVHRPNVQQDCSRNWTQSELWQHWTICSKRRTECNWLHCTNQWKLFEQNEWHDTSSDSAVISRKEHCCLNVLQCNMVGSVLMPSVGGSPLISTWANPCIPNWSVKIREISPKMNARWCESKLECVIQRSAFALFCAISKRNAGW